jgi:hypothetical protein
MGRRKRPLSDDSGNTIRLNTSRGSREKGTGRMQSMPDDGSRARAGSHTVTHTRAASQVPFAEERAHHTGWTQHSHDLVENFLGAASRVQLSPLQHSPVPTNDRLRSLEHTLGHLFTHRSLLMLALTHPSSVAQGSPNSKVLSWMGDSALHLAVTEQLAGSRVGSESILHSVGSLTEARARLVSRDNCRRCAESFSLGELMIYGKGVMVNHGRPTDDMLAEAFEAVMGAVYVDGGMEAVRKAYGRNFPLDWR